jgi:serine/threonine protein kinase
MAVSVGLAAITEEERQDVESWLAEFEQGWDEKRLKKQVRKLPPAGDARRLPALLEIVKFDLQSHWTRGKRVKIETYLNAFPELPQAGLVPDLIQAEIAARRRAGASVKMASFAQRFPDQIQHLRALDSSAPSLAAPSTDDADYSTRPGVEPLAFPLGSEPARLATSTLPEQFGRYRILQVLGQGAMGSVYLAHDSQLDRIVALKVPLGGATDSPRALERFYREARAAATLSHPNICPVYDVGTINGIHFVTMAYIEGKPLSALMRGNAPLPQKSVAAVIRKMALAMHEAHARGIIHRDLKPSNVMINRRQQPVIMDFGLARRAQEKIRLTQSGAIVGTPAYMSPEQVNGDTKAIGPASDVYSLGVILYEMLTGRLPFEGAVTKVLAAILTHEPTRPSCLRTDLDPPLEAICLRAMARQLPDRFGSMHELAAALTTYVKCDPGTGAHISDVPPQTEVKATPSAVHTVAEAGIETEPLEKLNECIAIDRESTHNAESLAATKQRTPHPPGTQKQQDEHTEESRNERRPVYHAFVSKVLRYLSRLRVFC